MPKKYKTVFVSGHFNVIHPGHLRLLKFAKECGTKLIVAVLSDRMSGSAAHVPEKLRLDGVACNSLVDEVVLLDMPITEIIRQLRPDIVVKGKEHESNINPEIDALSEYGGKLIFSSGETIFSSLDLLKKEFTEVSTTSIMVPKDYVARNNIDKHKLISICKKFNNLNIVVIGDLIIDEYITCEPLGMSQEDPTIVVTPIDHQYFVGGAGIVAAHSAGLGGHVNFITVTGNDYSKDFALKKLNEYKVKVQNITDTSRPTTLKQRFRCKGKSLLRVSHLHQGPVAAEIQDEIIKIIKKLIVSADLLVFSDFNYGCLPQSVVEVIVQLGKKNSVFMAADSQSSSQIGDISRFGEMDLITPTEREARIATRNHEDGLVVLAEKLRMQCKAKNIMLKLGEEGLLLHSFDYAKKNILTDKLPALNSHPKDVAGAGDSLLITSAMSLVCGASILESALLGSLAASIQVGRVGNSPLNVEDLIETIELALDFCTGSISGISA